MAESVRDPIQIDVTRGDLVESRHLAAAIATDAQGAVVAAWGEVDAPTFGRSAIKPLQALPLVESGAAEHYRLGDRELAIACGSHGGEPAHVEVVTAWLERIGCTVDDLACGAHPPLHEPTAMAMMRAGNEPTAVHNNCSGKHAGMLTHARHLGDPIEGYYRPDHPAQHRVRSALEGMTGLNLSMAARGVDGCGLPQHGLSLRAMARAMARMADPEHLPDERKAAAMRIRKAMAAAPFYLGGTGRFSTDVVETTAGRVLVKSGAEGMYAAILAGQGLGVAMKVLDGTARARDVAFAAVLRHLGALTDADWEALGRYVAPVLRNSAGTEIGTVRVAPDTLPEHG